MELATLLSSNWSIENTPTPAPRRKRVLTPEQLHINRIRSKEYYEAHKAKVLEKLRLNYASNRDKERQRQREKYRRSKARKMQRIKLPQEAAVRIVGAANDSLVTCAAVAPTPDYRLAVRFLLNN
ncbi:hypothetical protein H310_12963 [Aphanomyces invadans]|nr:hypothetical protein H310_12963 [Aphanomyces invadans]ETV92968.1 hypothetical protein H310_12963 [Aphanomyces invadans]|eukprot:XP_008878489.1 hypothetical protein H310_12963 [Aphanomyces invadans]